MPLRLTLIMRLLVVEDESKLAQYLHKGLSENGYTVDVASDGIEGRRLATGGDYDLVLLDIMLPGVDGYGVLSALRTNNRGTPVLMLTARDRVEDRVRGLEQGADDYLVKPFAFSELLARVAALLRRSPAGSGASTAAATQLRLGELELDLVARKATRAAQRLDLTAKEFNLLALLLRRRGQILSRTTLAEQVWDMNFDSDTNVVEVAVRRLRAKLDDPFDDKLLHTVRGMGYVLEERES
jgi:two-component system, OmpR family, copper resistance phosphate regulon response regulator CusR